MSPSGVFYILGTILLIIFVSAFVVTSISILKTLELVRKVLSNIDRLTKHIDGIKENLKSRALTLFVNFLSRFDKNDNRETYDIRDKGGKAGEKET